MLLLYAFTIVVKLLNEYTLILYGIQIESFLEQRSKLDIFFLSKILGFSGTK